MFLPHSKVQSLCKWRLLICCGFVKRKINPNSKHKIDKKEGQIEELTHKDEEYKHDLDILEVLLSGLLDLLTTIVSDTHTHTHTHTQ